jgi:putative ABC transport system permease protein
VFTSYRSAQDVDPLGRDRTEFIVARLAPGYDPEEVVSRLKQIRDVDVYTRDSYSLKTRLYWTWETGIGLGFGLTVIMAIVVGVVIVSQTIYSATIEHLREFGTLKAIGATNREVYGIILKQALINAALGYAVGLLITLLVVRSSGVTGLVLVVPPGLMVAVLGLTVIMCVTAATVSVRKALRVDPLVVFRA